MMDDYGGAVNKSTQFYCSLRVSHRIEPRQPLEQNLGGMAQGKFLRIFDGDLFGQNCRESSREDSVGGVFQGVGGGFFSGNLPEDFSWSYPPSKSAYPLKWSVPPPKSGIVFLLCDEVCYIPHNPPSIGLFLCYLLACYW